MGDITLLFLDIVLCAFCFFVFALILVNTISSFGVQSKFLKTMIDKGILSGEENVQRALDLQKSKKIVGVFISLVIVGVLIFTVIRIWSNGQNYGLPALLMVIVATLLGILKYRNLLSFNSTTVKTFKRNFANQYDNDKLNKYIDKTF